MRARMAVTPGSPHPGARGPLRPLLETGGGCGTLFELGRWNPAIRWTISTGRERCVDLATRPDIPAVS